MNIKLSVKTSNKEDILLAISVLQGLLPTTITTKIGVQPKVEGKSDTPITDEAKEERELTIARAKELGLEFRLSINTDTLAKRIATEELRLIEADKEEQAGEEKIKEEKDENSEEEKETPDVEEEEEAPAKSKKSSSPFDAVKKRKKKAKKDKKNKSTNNGGSGESLFG